MGPATRARIAALLPPRTRFVVSVSAWDDGSVCAEIMAWFEGGAWRRWCGTTLEDAIGRMRGERRGRRAA